ncbi:BMP family protein [Herbiconiux sp. CPCC 203407]|uniref:BMP family protein n=1 Tax=Herbiconiux oxytropis TaxID=2970915 RepID=A0AA41XFG4_9MICO|nr:BMP family protein [Herbiconiux oxytropis]MCS5722364.1 BMP family protein [Herbiconiux oxytropis]MCS5727239.1 BMP family protein [Herbiconiux oxytropis]
MSRKVFTAAVLGFAALALTACGTGATGAGSGSSTSGAGGDGAAPRVAALFTQSIDQGNWDPAGYEAYQDMCDANGFDCTYVEQATYEQAPSLLRDYAQQGYDLVIAHSSGYAAAMKETAAEFPDTEFSLFSYESDLEDLPNYSAWSVDWTQAGFLQGVVAGLVSPTGAIAAVGGEQLPSSEDTMKLLESSALTVNPAASVSQVWIGSFTDVAKGKQLALQAVSSGADFLVPMADSAGQGVQQAAEESGTLSLGEYVDESDTYPSVVTSVMVDFAAAYDEIGAKFADGTLGGTLVTMDASTGAFSFAPFHHVDASVEEKAQAALDGLADGSITAG